MNPPQWQFAPELVETALLERLPATAAGDAAGLTRLREAMRYGALGGGKRMRPQLVLHAAVLVGGPGVALERALPAACALELIHAYSLVHDDLPAMDDAATRRGRPTCHVAFDDATAILAGDALLTLAFEVLAGNEESQPERAVALLQVLRLVAVAAGEAGMVGGQSIDILWSSASAAAGTQITGAQLAEMHALKTGALIRASAECGALLGGGTPQQVLALRHYGENLGRAFQIWDDVLDVEGDPEVMGKSSTDAANAKMTFVAVYGLEQAKIMAREASTAAVDAVAEFGPEAATLRDLARYVVLRNK